MTDNFVDSQDNKTMFYIASKIASFHKNPNLPNYILTYKYLHSHHSRIKFCQEN